MAQDPPTVYHFPASRLVAEPHVRDVSPSALRSAPDHRRTFSWDENRNRGYISGVRSQGYIDSLLLARETATGLELVEGHKRRWVAEQAGLDTVAVQVVDLDAWEAAVHYAQDHLPSMDESTAQQTMWALAVRWGIDRVDPCCDRAPLLRGVDRHDGECSQTFDGSESAVECDLTAREEVGVHLESAEQVRSNTLYH